MIHRLLIPCALVVEISLGYGVTFSQMASSTEVPIDRGTARLLFFEPKSISATRDLLQNTANQAKRTLSTSADDQHDTLPTSANEPLVGLKKMAILKPHQDVAIDATCGNGPDSAGIASLLFSNEDL